MEKTFDPAAVEARISQAWEAAEAFKAGRPERAGAQPYTIVIPPPNVTGSLHMGHALNNTLQDILCRFERMRGRDVLWQPGTDHAGIATQMVVERQLAERQQPGRRDMGREAFLKRVWEWKEESGGAIVNQLKRLGASCDWSRERFTMGRREDGEAGQMQRAVLKVFVQLHREGLIYRDKRLVNWDPKFQTAISDLEVQQVEVRGHMWYFNYPLEGAVYDPADDRTFITIATTRPETMLGDGAVAVHPENERLGWMIGKRVILPLVNRILPVIGDTYADPEKGTGAVKITAAHDFNDFEVARRHNVPLINLMTPNAHMVDEPHMPAQYRGLDRYECRKRVVADLEAMGLVNKIEPHTHMVPHGDRSGVVIEPYLTDQWYVDAKTLAQPALAAVREGRTTFVPKNWEKTYFEWLDNIQPWCVSRQLWWGHQIPAWYGVKVTRTDTGGSFEPPKGADSYEIFVAESEAEAVALAAAYYGPGIEVRIAAADAKAAPFGFENGGLYVTLTRDADVLDTWFSSALWPFSTLGWPDDAAEVKRFYPTSTLVTGFDIIFFWVARMMMMGLHFMGREPFKDVYIHALVRDEKGAKMSKSKGNVMDPLVLIDEYGADALRFTLAAMAAQGRDIKLSKARVEGYRNFATKLWNAARFAEMNHCLVHDPAFQPREAKEALNLWAFGELAKMRNEITQAIEAYRFNDAANAAYRFVWGVFCDWYVELAKPVLQGEDGPAKSETRGAMAFLLYEIVKLLHPFMPFLTEELWSAVTHGERGVLALAHWPKLEGLEHPASEAEIGWLVELVSEIRSVRSEMNVPGGAPIPLLLVNCPPDVEARARTWTPTLLRLARLSDVGFAAAAPKGSAQLLIRGTLAALPLAGIIDLTAEEARLEKEIGKLRADVGKTVAKLENADFVSRAPEEIIEENRDRVTEWTARIAQLEAALARLRDR